MVRTFTEADKFCQRWGGHLASINNDEESHQLESLFVEHPETPFWIGAKRPAGNSSFVWTDEQPFMYERFSHFKSENITVDHLD